MQTAVKEVIESSPQSSGMLPPDLQEGYAQLRTLNLFDGIPNDELRDAIATGAISRRVLDRDEFVSDPRSARDGGYVYFVADGQLAVAVFDTEEYQARRRQMEEYKAMSEEERSALVPEPLARLAKKNLAVFSQGDLFNTAALPSATAMTTTPSRDSLIAFYTVAPAVVAVLTPACVGDLVLRFPFFEARMRRAIDLARERLHNVAGVKQEILDFFVRQGLSVSGEMVRVRQLDLCIDCKLCEMACETRYGAKRLTLGGFRLGMLDFIYTCRTCTDQRCVDPCDYDAISFHADRGEVVINEAHCTGCTLCAQLCPYGAIEMVDVEDPSNSTYREEFKLRLEDGGKLAFGAGKPRVARARRIANKCDHCTTYNDQACVTACPTGSLIEINAYDLFRERSPAARILARSGYDQDAPRDRRELLPTEPFVRGAHVRDGGLAKIRRWRVGAAVMWVLGLAAWFLVLAEIGLRLYAPQSSLEFYWLVNVDGLDPGFALIKVGYRAGDTLAVWCGYGGTGLMLIAILYPMVRRFRAFRLVANNALWFDFHMMSGTVGPMFIVLHSALKLDNWVSAAFWSMIIVAVSGVVGRYMYTQVPDLLNGRELEELEHRKALAAMRAQFPVAVGLCDTELAANAERAGRASRNHGLWRTFAWIVLEDLRRPGRWLARRRGLRAAGLSRKQRKELAARTARLLLIDRRRVLLPRAQLVLHSWKKVHVPFSFVMAAISVVHIWVAFKYSM